MTSSAGDLLAASNDLRHDLRALHEGRHKPVRAASACRRHKSGSDEGRGVQLIPVARKSLTAEELTERLETSPDVVATVLRPAIDKKQIDLWEIAMAWVAKALAAPTLEDLRQLVDEAASRASAVGNVTELATLLGAAVYSALWENSDGDAQKFLDRAEPIARTLDDSSIRTLIRGNAGLTAVLTGDTDGARRAFREELEFCRQTVYLPYAYEGLLGLAAVAAVDGDLQRAARLTGAATAHRHGAPHTPVDDRLDAAFFNDARTRYGAHAWDATARDGAALSSEDAIAYALKERRA